MKTRVLLVRPTTFLLLFIAITLWLHMYITQYTFSSIPLALALAAALPYTMPHAAMPLFALLVVAELFTTFPLGIMTAVIVLPYVIQRMFQQVEPGPSILFAALIAGTVGLQLLTLVSAQLFLTWPMDPTWLEVWNAIPIKPTLVTWLLTSLLVIAFALIWDEYIHTRQSVKPPRIIR